MNISPRSGERRWRVRTSRDGCVTSVPAGFLLDRKPRPVCLRLHPLPDGFGAFLHQPLRSGRGPADAYRTAVLQPGEIDFRRGVHQIRAWVHAPAFVVQDFSIGTFFAAHEKNHIVARGEIADVRHAVSHLAANGVVVTEGGCGRDVRADVFHDFPETLQRFGGLRIQANVPVEIQFVHFFRRFDDDGLAVGLSHETEHLGMAVLSVDDDLFAFRAPLLVFLFDAFL